MDTLVDDLALLPIATFSLAGTAISVIWYRNRQRRERLKRDYDARMRVTETLLEDIRERERRHIEAADHRQHVLQAERQAKHLQSAVAGTVVTRKPPE